MRIGEVAKRAKVSVRAIRHYDACGLLQPHRQENGYRSFTATDVERVQLIQLLLSVGFRLHEIRDHAPCWRSGCEGSVGDVTREQTTEFLRQKLIEVDERIQAITTVRARLQDQLQLLAEDGMPPQDAAIPT